MRLRTLAVAAATAALIPALAACGSVSSNTTSSPSVTAVQTPSAPSTTTTSAQDAAMVKGLQNLASLGHQIAATADVNAAKALADGLEGYWAPIEDHVRELDSSTYIDIEDAMTALESGQPSQTKDAAASLQQVVTAFIRAHS